MRTEIKPASLVDVAGPTKLTHETLRSGRRIPVYEPFLKSEKIKTRKYNDVVRKYKQVKNISELLKKGYKITGFEDFPNGESEEEKLAAVSNELMIVKAKDKPTVHRIVPKKRMTYYKQMTHTDQLDTNFHKCISDEWGVMCVSFRYNKQLDGDSYVVHFSFVYIDRTSLECIQHQHDVHIDIKADLKFDLMLCAGTLCVVWKTHNLCSCWNFNNSTELTYIQFEIQENLLEVYHISLDEEFLHVVVKDEDFYDDVFSSSNASKRLSVHYSVKTGLRLDTKQTITDALEQDAMDYPTDVVFVNIPFNPTWIVFEWLIPEMTLSCIYFYRLGHDGRLKRDRVMNFQEIFPEYKTYFGRLNELQSKIIISRDPWQVYFWTSKNHVLIIDPNRYEIVAILKMDLEHYKDFKNEIYDFELNISKPSSENSSRNNNRNVTLYVKRYNETVHFSKFCLPPSRKLSTAPCIEGDSMAEQKIISTLRI